MTSANQYQLACLLSLHCNSYANVQPSSMVLGSHNSTSPSYDTLEVAESSKKRHDLHLDFIQHVREGHIGLISGKSRLDEKLRLRGVAPNLKRNDVRANSVRVAGTTPFSSYNGCGEHLL